MAITFQGTDTYPTKKALSSNYLDIQNNGWAQQYLPELYEQEVERYGNRSVSSFLRMVGAEMPMASDQVIWSEQGRLHLSYGDATGNGAVLTDASAGLVTISAGHAIRKGQLVVISDGTVTTKGYVSAVPSSTTLNILPYSGASLDLAPSSYSDADPVKLFVFGSEFAKGKSGMEGDTINPTFTTFTNKPVIIKDKFEVSGSDAAQIGWVEVSGESGEAGYLWYIKAEGETRTRFEDYLEMTLVEAEKAVGTSVVENQLTAAGDDAGTEGLFAAIETRGHTADIFDAGDNAAATSADVKEIIEKLDAQGAIEENMFFLNRNSNLLLDDWLASQNSYGANGTSYGVFENSEDMALNLGFSGFRRGSYDFYKSDWKYLNDGQTRGLINDVRGVLVPAGTSSVYDQALGKNIRRPFLHVRYRASEADDRRMKSWVTGSVGGATTSDLDAMEVHYLSERCLVVQAANNFMLIGD